MDADRINEVAKRGIEVGREYQLVLSTGSVYGRYLGSAGDWQFFDCDGERTPLLLSDPDVQDVLPVEEPEPALD